MAKHNITVYKELKLRLDLKIGSFEDAMNAINELIDNNIYFDGIFATNEWRAHGALIALQNHNILVPDNIKIVGYDGTYVSKYSNPPITTIYQDKKNIAFKSSELLLNLINDEPVDENKDIVIPIELIKRKTT